MRKTLAERAIGGQLFSAAGSKLDGPWVRIADAEKAVSEARNKALEEAAALCENIRPDGGRVWTETQEQCYSALTEAAEGIRNLRKTAEDK